MRMSAILAGTYLPLSFIWIFPLTVDFISVIGTFTIRRCSNVTAVAYRRPLISTAHFESCHKPNGDKRRQCLNFITRHLCMGQCDSQIHIVRVTIKARCTSTTKPHPEVILWFWCLGFRVFDFKCTLHTTIHSIFFITLLLHLLRIVQAMYSRQVNQPNLLPCVYVYGSL